MTNAIDQKGLTARANETLQIPNWLFCLILSSIPIATALLGFTTAHGFLTLPRFGEGFRAQAMQPVKEYAPPVKKNDIGYDGQFYAQIALDPTLQDPSLRTACDNLSYRAKRIGLPSLAFVLGAGHPWAILQIYSTLNIAFWFLLFVVLLREFRIDTWQNRLLVIGVLWNAGCIISIYRALTDLPSLCLGVIAICLQSKNEKKSRDLSWILASVFASLAVLTKETALLSFFSFFDGSIRRRWRHALVMIALVIMPIGIWSYYVRHQIGIDATGFGNFAAPLYGFSHKLYVEWRKAFLEFPKIPILELIAPWSIVVQIVFMIRNASWRSKWWRFGIGFAVLAIVIGPWVWATQSAYSRCLLPLAVSFNVLLSQASMNRSSHWKWWILGNIGLMDRAAIGLLVMWIVDMTWKRNAVKATPTSH